jgi:DNA-binding NtrC family response regulator
MADKSEPRDDGPELAVDGLQWRDVGIRLRELSEQLRAVADYVDDKVLEEEGRQAYEHGHAGAIDEYEAETERRFRRTLSGLGTYRRNYHHWERVIAEFALAKMNYTQRDTAQLLGVGLSTINRWAQNPLPLEDER